jgi:hypothetical protein
VACDRAQAKRNRLNTAQCVGCDVRQQRQAATATEPSATLAACPV